MCRGGTVQVSTQVHKKERMWIGRIVSTSLGQTVGRNGSVEMVINCVTIWVPSDPPLCYYKLNANGRISCGIQNFCVRFGYYIQKVQKRCIFGYIGRCFSEKIWDKKQEFWFLKYRKLCLDIKNKQLRFLKYTFLNKKSREIIYNTGSR